VEGKPYSIESGWAPDPLLIARELEVVDQELWAFYKPLLAARRVIADDVEAHFINEESPDHVAWKEYAPSYKKRGEQNVGKLRKSGALFEAATNPESYEITPRGVSKAAIGGGSVALVGSNLPDYWVYHDQPDNPGTSEKLPQRKFEGLSDEALAKIDIIFDQYVERAFLGATKYGQPIVMGPTGRPSFATFYYSG
jgi:hypothetical protein